MHAFLTRRLVRPLALAGIVVGLGTLAGCTNPADSGAVVVSFFQQAIFIRVGNPGVVSATVTQGGTYSSRQAVLTSSNPGVATVAQNGRVDGISIGRTEITATVDLGSNNKSTAVATVTVCAATAPSCP
jgi:hypothetical protein